VSLHKKNLTGTSRHKDERTYFSARRRNETSVRSGRAKENLGGFLESQDVQGFLAQGPVFFPFLYQFLYYCYQTIP
jgi:hypothetical protein